MLSDVLAFSLDVDACTMPAVCCISAMRSANPSDSSSSWPLPLRDLLPPGLPLLLLKNNFKVLECFTLSYISHRRRFITSLHFTGHREYRKHLNVSFLMFYDRYKARYDSLFLRGIFFLAKKNSAHFNLLAYVSTQIFIFPSRLPTQVVESSVFSRGRRRGVSSGHTASERSNSNNAMYRGTCRAMSKTETDV